MSEENVKVAVRVRPFNGRERDRNAQCIIEMSGAQTLITDPSGENEPKKFNFDFSYWSHDGCKDDGTGYFAPDTSHANGKKFADQKRVFNELGIGILTNAWDGYNSTLFAYGQTGSGKSWSMVGYGVNKGIVPLYCDNLFSQINEKKTAGAKENFEVTFSMLEIYNENVRDLLDSNASKSGLKVRQDPKKGFYASGLKELPVANYEEIEMRIAEGTRNRTVASTKMNATSSRAHTIVSITFVQKSVNDAGKEVAKASDVNLVDLAGSERADSTGATGDRLKEGAAINQSLSSLGNCIAALADRSAGKNTRVPFRDSVLTKLLKNALGGNSKTIMIAALSPADINYDETLSTLRYADRAKQIKTTAKVNEDPTEALVRSLQEENEKLKALLAGKGGDISDLSMLQGEDDEEMTDEEKAQLKKELQEEYEAKMKKNEEDLKKMEQEFEQRLKEAQGTGDYKDIAEINEKKKKYPHLYNLNMDPQMTGRIIHFIVEDSMIVIGNGKDPETDLTLRGGSIKDRHCVINEKDGVFTLETFPDARTLRNGKSVTSETKTLKHHDRLLFGTTQFYVFCNPAEAKTSKVPAPDFEMAQAEIAEKSGGFNMSGQNASMDDALLQAELIECMPAVEEANSISEALGKGKRFDMLIVSPEARGEVKGKTEVMVKMTDVNTRHEWMWNRSKFLDRKCIMAEMFDKYEDGEQWDKPQAEDPFYEDPKEPYHIGSVKMWLKSLSYMLEAQEALDVTDFKGTPVGKLNLGIFPCDAKGKEYTEKDNKFVENPEDLTGQPITFKIKIVNARGLPNKYTDVYCKYKVYHEENMTQTKPIANTTNPDFNESRVINLGNGTPETISFLTDGAFTVQIWGKQKDQKKGGAGNKMKVAAGGAGLHTVNTNQKTFDPERVRAMLELSALKKRQEKMQQKLDHMRKMIDVAEEHKKRKVSTKIIKDIYNAPNNDVADKCIALIPLEKDSDDEDGGDSRPVGVVPPHPASGKKKRGSKSSSSGSSSDSDKNSKKNASQKKGSAKLTLKTKKTGDKKKGDDTSSSSSDSDSSTKKKGSSKKSSAKMGRQPETPRSQKSKSGTCVML